MKEAALRRPYFFMCSGKTAANGTISTVRPASSMITKASATLGLPSLIASARISRAASMASCRAVAVSVTCTDVEIKSSHSDLPVIGRTQSNGRLFRLLGTTGHEIHHRGLPDSSWNRSPWPLDQSMTSKNIPLLSISDSRSAACFFQSGVSRTRNLDSSPCAFSASSVARAPRTPSYIIVKLSFVKAREFICPFYEKTAADCTSDGFPTQIDHHKGARDRLKSG